MPTVLLTGAGRGLGLEFVRQYGTAGWDIIACVRDPVHATELAHYAETSSGKRIQVEKLDVADPASIAALGTRLGARPIDVLLNVAGTMGRGSFAKQGLEMGKFGVSELDDWLETFRVNLFGPMKLAETLVQNVAASQQKKIVTLTSVLGSISKNTIGGLYAYRISKAGVNAMMRSMSIDLGRKFGIIATPLHPGWVRTDMGGPRADIDAPESIAGMIKVIDGLTKEKAGRFWMYDGSELPW